MLRTGWRLLACAFALAACSFDPCESQGGEDAQLRRTIGTPLSHSTCADSACLGDVSPADAARLWSQASSATFAADRGALPPVCAPLYAQADVREQQAALMRGGGSECIWTYWYVVSPSAGKVCAFVEPDASLSGFFSRAIHRFSH